MSKKLTAITSLIAYLGMVSGVVLAQDGNVNLQPPSSGFGNIPTNINLTVIVGGVIQLLLLVAAVFFLVYLLIGGIKWIMSGGDKGQIEAARNQITHAIVGLLIVFGAWIVISLVKAFFGIDILNPPIPNFTGAT